MKIIDIRLENFRAHEKTYVTFPEGIIGIIGDNESGKTTILEAVEWCLFGGNVTRGTKNSIRWNRAPARKTANATLRFEVGGVRYRIERGETSAMLYDDESGAVLAEGTNPVNQTSPRILGMGHDEFVASYFVRQKDVTRLSAMKPTERVAFIRKVMGVGRIDAALKECRKVKSQLSATLAGMSAGLGDRDPFVEAVDDATGRVRFAQDEHAAAQDAMATASARYETASKDFAELDAIKAKRDELLKEADEVHQDLAFNSREYQTHVESMGRYDKAEVWLAENSGDIEVYEAAKAKLERIQPRIAELQRVQRTFDALSQKQATLVEGRRQAIEALAATEIVDVDAMEAGLEDLESEVHTQRAARAEIVEGLQAVAARTAYAASSTRDQLQRLRELGGEGQCPTCYQTIGDAVAQVIADAEVRLEQEEAEHKDAADALHKAKENPELEEANARARSARLALAVARKQQVARNDALRNFTFLDDQLAAVDADIAGTEDELESADWPTQTEVDDVPRLRALVDELATVEKTATRATVLLESKPETETALKGLEVRHAELSRRKTMLQDGAEALGFKEAEWSAANTEKDATGIAYTNARIKEAGDGARVRSAEAALEVAEKALASYDEKAGAMAETEAEHLLHELLALEDLGG